MANSADGSYMEINEGVKYGKLDWSGSCYYADDHDIG